MTGERGPGWATRILERHLRESERHALGDLDEDYAARGRSGHGRLFSELWYLREASSLVFAIVRDRWAQRWRVGRSKSKDTWGGDMMGIGRDGATALRGLRRAPGFTLAIGLTLAVAIGATTTIFSLANAAFLRPLPYPDADRLVSVYSGDRDDPATATAIAPLDWRDFADFPEVIEATAVWSLGESVHMTEAEQTIRLVAPRASVGLFAILGAQPVVGRFFTPEEMIPERDDAIVLSYGFWERAFGADRQAINRTVELDGRRYRVVGVGPREGMLPRDADIWRPLALGPEWYETGRWGWQFLAAVARLRPGADLATATRALNDRLAEVNPDRVNRLGQTRVLRALYDERSGESGAAILMLLAAVVSVLAMACANVITVTLVRSETRVREFSLRRALGSSAAPLVRMVGAETLVLASIGGLGGFALAHFGLRAIAATELDALTALGPIGLDGTAMAFALILTVVTAALIGVAPVLVALNADPQAVLNELSTRSGVSRRTARFRDALVVVQVSLALALLVTVGFSASAFRSLVSRDPGFVPEDVLTVTMEFPADGERVGDPAEFYRGLVDRLNALPGVTSAGATNFLPLEGIGWSASFGIVDSDRVVTDDEMPHGNMRAVSAAYFATVGIRFVEGRAFTDADTRGTTPVAIVDETIARRFWPEGSPIGRQAQIGGLSREPATIIGVVGDVPDEGLESTTSGHVYFPVLQSPQRRMTLVVKTSGDPTALTPAVRQAIREMDARIPITRVATFEARIADTLSARKLGLILLGLFGATAVLLAGVGVYGVLAYTVARRTKEIGTRMALGAAPDVVLRAVIGHAMRLWAVGATAGIVVAFFAVDVMGRYVPGVESGSPLPYLGAFVAMGCTAAVSATLPARRAVRVDPVQTLRAE